MAFQHLVCLVVAVSKVSLVASFASSECASASSVSCPTQDELLLMQRKRATQRDHSHDVHEGFPNVGKIKDIVDSISKGLPGVDGAMTAAIEEVSEKVNKSMDTIDKHATVLARKAAVAQRRFVVSVNQTLEEKISALASLVNVTLTDSSELWESTGAEIDALVSVLSQGVRALGKDELASKLQAALGETVERAGNLSSWAEAVKNESTSLALNDAARSLSVLRSTLAEGTRRAEDFVNACDASFNSLAVGTIASVQDSLPQTVANKIGAGMLGVVRRVNTSVGNLLNLTANVTAELLATVDGVQSEVEALGGSSDGKGMFSKMKRFFDNLFR